MSLPTEIQRLQTNVNGIVSDTHAILDAIAAKGVVVPEGSTLHDCPALIAKIGTSANSNT